MRFSSYSKRLVPDDSPVVYEAVGELEDVLYEKSECGIARITINRPEKRNAFRPKTVTELLGAFDNAGKDKRVRVIILRGQGEDAFCSGGDQSVRTTGGYQDDSVDHPTLSVLELQSLIRRTPKPVIAAVSGYAVGGGHVLHMVCDLTIAADNAVFGQTGPRVGSFDAGLGAAHMARLIGQKRAREMWFLCRMYSAERAYEMGLVNAVVPLKQLEEETHKWAREIMLGSPTAIRILKFALNAAEDGHMGLQQLAGECTGLFYQTEESLEGKQAFIEKRKPAF